MPAARCTSGEEIVRVATDGRRLEDLLSKEWLLTNARGSFASSTIAGCHTSGYHGLLVGSPDPLVRRIMALSTCLEIIQWSGRTIELSTFEFADRFAPAGYMHLHEFRRDTGAHFLFRTEPADVCKSVYLARDSDTVLVEYAFDEVRDPVDFILRPFIGMRDFHTLQRSDAPLACRIADRTLLIRHGATTDEMSLGCPALAFQSDPQWWFHFVYRVNRSRGLAHAEDLWAPGFFLGRVERPGRIVFWAHLNDRYDPGQAPQVDAETIKRDLLRHQEQLLDLAGAKDKTHRILCLAADQFVARRRSAEDERTTIVAGFPWFCDWGRDTFLSLPGLLLATGRHEEAGSVLRTFAAAVDEGMIPNRFDDRTGEAEFNSVDASLWFIHAAFEYLDATENADKRVEGVGTPHAMNRGMGFQPMNHRQDAEATKSRGHELALAQAGDARDTFSRELLPALRSIIDAYQKGTRFGIRADSDGLLTAGDANTQLTWMDAKCDGIAFTPRCGKAVEVNALWHNALCRMAKFCRQEAGGKSEIRNPKSEINPKHVIASEARQSKGSNDRNAGAGPGAVSNFRNDTGQGPPNAKQGVWGPQQASACGGVVDIRISDLASQYAALAEQVGRSFCTLFWNAQQKYLNDVVRPDGTVDTSLRPNQIFAVSLPFGPPLSRVQQRSVVNAVTQGLLTPYGPRTLSSRSPAYRGRYEGSPRQRDEAYHQGTVWPYLLGPFLEAYLKVNDHSARARGNAAELIRPLLRHLVEDGCLGSISEIFDGDPPHRPCGCLAQAWSVAELLRIYRMVTTD